MLDLLRLLQDGRFHSGAVLARTLGLSRTAIWKRLKKLESELGLAVHSVPGRGYQLASPLSLLDEHLGSFDCLSYSCPIHILMSVDSTNAEALRRLGRGAAAPFMLLAEQQSAGRGRRGRGWVSPFAENLYCSLALPVTGGVSQVAGLSLTIGLAVLRSVQAFGAPSAGLKWPNDVLVGDGRKISGILLDISGNLEDRCNVVIGIGVNLNMLLDSDITQPWTSLRQETGKLVDRNEFVRHLSGQLAHYLGRHWQHGFSALREEWETAHLWQGKKVRLISGDQEIAGSVSGVANDGAIRLEIAGKEHAFNGGELSLRLRNDS